jgi:hypothetical protein
MARMSLSAGVMSSQVAKPAKPAPALAMVSIAVAGTILARTVPNRSTNEIRKYLTPCSFAYAESGAIPSLLDPVPVCDLVPVAASGWANPARAAAVCVTPVYAVDCGPCGGSCASPFDHGHRTSVAPYLSSRNLPKANIRDPGGSADRSRLWVPVVAARRPG